MWYSYALLRVVPRVERGECLNVGVVLFAPTARYLDARMELDSARLLALDPRIDLERLRRHLATFVAVCRGDEGAGLIAQLSLSERFHWLTAPRSTIIQPSAVHAGCCEEPQQALEELLTAYVRLSAREASGGLSPRES